MQAIDHDVLAHARDWLQDTRPWLCTIVGTLGSSPRPVGSVVVNGERQIYVLETETQEGLNRFAPRINIQREIDRGDFYEYIEDIPYED